MDKNRTEDSAAANDQRSQDRDWMDLGHGSALKHPILPRLALRK
jgi:hypothetical protein